MRMRYLIFACAIGVVLVAPALPAPANMSAPAHMRHPRTWLQITDFPDDGGYTSPDGRYLAEALGGDCEPRMLEVYAVKKWRGRSFRRRIYSGLIDFNTFAWVPHRPHTLIAGTGGTDYGVGVLALWDGGRRRLTSTDLRYFGSDMWSWHDPHLKLLLRARQEVGEGFQLVAVSANGRAVRYKHGGYGDDGMEGPVHTLRLPAR